MYCLDSSIVIEIFHGNEIVKSKLGKIEESEIFITAITACEIYKGAFLSKNPEKDIFIVNNFLRSVNILDLDVYSGEVYGKVYAELKKSGNLTQDFDLMIAAICIANNKTLITRNKKHFENIKQLKVESW